jgi:dolichyl-diphosphooligosaccharide--protein glycosyltransferase
VDADCSPLHAGLPIVVGLAVASSLAGAVHVFVGWHTAEVAFSPALVLAGSLLLIALAEIVARTTGDVRHLLLGDLIAGILGIVGFVVLFPNSWNALLAQLDRLIRSDAIAETAGLFDPGTLGVVLLLGFALFLALPGMIWAIPRARTDARWGVLAVYAWYFLALSALQVRFVGEFAPFVAVFAGLGFVWLAAWIDVIPGPDFDDRYLNPLRVPNRRTLATLALLFLLVGSLGIIQVPVKNSQVLVDDDAVRSAAFIDDRAEGLNQTYPENYVFSQWGANRMYNYFVSGESRSYAYAQRNFQNFSESRNPDEWYDRLGNRVGYIVMRTAEGANGSTARWQLSREFGSATPTSDGLAHYRALYRSPDGSRTVFGVVPGAVINGSAAPNATVTVSTVVTIPGAEFEYERRTNTDPSGDFAVRVANPGDYRVSGPEQSATVTVPSEEVRNGTRVPV